MANKRHNVISKNEVYMLIARIIAKRSKDPNTQVGAVIVSEDDRILSVGYNGFPNGISDDDPSYDWADRDINSSNNKYLYSTHAEANAILNYRGDIRDLKNATLYVTLFPCNECAKMVIQTGISYIIYLSDKYHDSTSSVASRKMFGTTHTKFTQYESSIDDKADMINSIMVLGSSPKYRNLSADQENLNSLIEDWYNDILNYIR